MMQVLVVLRCEGCGARLGTVRDARFGLLPSGSLCPSCGEREAMDGSTWG